AGDGPWELLLNDQDYSGELPWPVSVAQSSDAEIVVHTGKVRCRLRRGDARILSSASSDSGENLGNKGVAICCIDARGARRRVTIESLRIVESGPLRAQVEFTGVLGRGTDLRLRGHISFFAGLTQVRIELTAQNPRRARHPGGYWDLGDPGSVLVKQWSVEIEANVGNQPRVAWTEQPGSEAQEVSGRLEILQESSGGKQWNSRNHVNREGRVPLRFRGYSFRTADGECGGERASPAVAIQGAAGQVACAIEEFWQKFPSGLVVDENRISAQLWPGSWGDLHELQAGEHCTRTVWLDFGRNAAAPCDGLSWVHRPPRAIADPEWLAASGAIPLSPSPQAPVREEYQLVLREAADGPHSLLGKRERIDEYGWRNFGDVWADHEQAFGDDPRPVISHYNNQYDLLHSLLIHYLLSGDARWWALADPLARHVLDIDIYHTTRDKPAYNGGLFWHTAHYHDAGKSSHRCVSAAMQGKKIPAPGTGPCNEHNYTRGLSLYYYLTGCERARRAVLSMADWVLAMDDGCRHLLGILSSQPTGDASRTCETNYHGPGRGAGNSIHALLDAWQLTGESHYLAKAAELVRRCIHPADDIAARDLASAERRWSYAVFLQALVRLIDAIGDVPEWDLLRDYARQSLLHYARWMAAHERFYLDEPEKLEYPTETWAAQELRKGNTLLMAARYAAGAEAARFRQRGREMLDRAWQSLLSFESRRTTRPVAVAMQQGYLEAYLQSEDRAPALAPGGEDNREIGEPAVFMPQKQAIRHALRSPRGLLSLIGCAVQPGRWYSTARQTWPAERLRRLLGASWLP
ncbi:MAG TPA: hypothetical protein VFB80_17345, partial [Pirellulaceae bacterium]|nr:hypothetical protein [Pirellulaceae bacterium]